MPLQYRDRELSPFPAMGSSFSNAAIALQRLRMQQQQQQLQNYYRNLDVGLEREKLDITRRKEEGEMARSKQLMDAAKSFSDAIRRMNNPQRTVPGGTGPATEEAYANQDAMSALALVVGSNPAASARVFEPQQFTPGRPVYSPLVGMGGPQEPLFTAPLDQFQQRSLALRAREQSLRAFQAKRNYAARMMAELERRRHNKASKSERDESLDQLEMQRRLGGGASRFKIEPIEP